MDPMEYMWINPRRAASSASRALRSGSTHRAKVIHTRYRDEQGFIVRLYNRFGDELGLLHPDGLMADYPQLEAAA